MNLRLVAALALPVLWIAPAQAGPREDALATAARCGSYQDDRQWLECYYGAVQPMRAHLGLPAASVLQQDLAGSATGHGPGPFSVTTSAPLAHTDTGPAISGDFGFSRDEYPEAERRGLAAKMTSYQINAVTSMFVVKLENGQTWEQISGDSVYAHWSGPAGRMAVTITHGSFGGGYILRVKGRVGAYRVRRVS